VKNASSNGTGANPSEKKQAFVVRLTNEEKRPDDAPLFEPELITGRREQFKDTMSAIYEKRDEDERIIWFEIMRRIELTYGTKSDDRVTLFQAPLLPERSDK
jgi:hypothetical protein